MRHQTQLKPDQMSGTLELSCAVECGWRRGAGYDEDTYMCACAGLSASGVVSGGMGNGQVAGMRIWGACDLAFTFTESQCEELVWSKKFLENCRHSQSTFRRYIVKFRV